MPNILIIDDNLEILETNRDYLTGVGYHVTVASTGKKAIAYLNNERYDCIVMDIMLPDIDGFALCKAARILTSAPILFLSCLDAPHDKVKGLMAGGDDYMTKPYSQDELSARIHAHLRRERRAGRHITVGKVYIDKQNRMIQTPEQNVFLTQKEFDLFLLLFENPNKMFSKKELLNNLWTEKTDIGTVALHVMKLRRKLSLASTYTGTIENDYKNGYYISRDDTSAGETK